MERLKIDKWKLYEMLEYKVHHETVRRFHDSDARIKVCCAPARTTKSFCSAHDVLPDILSPGTRGWIVGPNYSLAEKEFRYIHEALVINRNKLGLPKPKVCLTNHRSGALIIEWAAPWGSIVECKSADNPDSLLGEAIDWVIYSEASKLPRQIRERYVQPRTITRKGRELVPTTPSPEGEWVKELWDIGQYREQGIDSFSWDYTANPLYDKSEFERARKFYGEDNLFFREQYLGEWVFFGGVVYVTRDDTHWIDPFDIPKDWPIIRGIDFGHRDPFVCLWCAVGPNNELYFFKEYYCREGKSIREHAMKIKEMSAGYKITKTVCDPESAQSIEDLCYEGIPAYAANRDRQAGRLRMLEYLNISTDVKEPFHAKVQGLQKDKWANAYYFNTMKESKQELRNYRWKERGRIEHEKEKTEGADHACLHPDTLVITDKGKFKIKELVGKEGKVQTVFNQFTEFKDVRLTRKNQPVVTVNFSDGSYVTCTKDHKFLTSDGWINAIDLNNKYCYNVVSQTVRRSTLLWKLQSYQKLNRLLMEKTSIFAGGSSQDNIEKKNHKDSIGRSGNFIMGKSLKDTISIILIEIGQIIKYQILNCFLVLNTYLYTQKNRIILFPTLQEQRHQSGIKVRTVENGIKNIMKMLKTCYIRNMTSFVNNVASLFNLSLQENFALMPASLNTGLNQALIMKKDYAPNAERDLLLTDTQKKELAQKGVLQKVCSVIETGFSDVYCLNVPKTHAFAVENGVVVHNCDVMRYIVMERPSPYRNAPRVVPGTFNYHLNKFKASKVLQGAIGR